MACFVPLYSNFVTGTGPSSSSRNVSLAKGRARLSWQCKSRTRPRSSICMSGASEVKDMLVSTNALDRIRGINRAFELDSTSEIVSALISIATEDDNQQVRYVAISRLAGLEPASLSEEEKDSLLTAARFVLGNDTEPSCQAGAADLIAGLRLSNGFDDLIAAFNTTSDWMLKFSIAAGLGEMGDPKAFEFLISVLGNEAEDNSLLLSAIIGSLGELGDERAIPIVERYLGSKDQSVKERAAIAHDRLVKSKDAG